MIKKLTAEHIDEIYKLSSLAYAVAPWNIEQYQSAFNQKFHQAYGYFIQNKCVAFIQIQVICGEGEILNLATHPNYRGRGIAKLLIHEIISQANRWLLEVRASNKVAQNLYEACGFKKINERKDYYKNPSDDAWIMEREEIL